MNELVVDPEGMIFAGRYRVVRLIGRGGMANVYLASDITSNMNVAIKILKPEFSSDGNSLEDLILRLKLFLLFHMQILLKF